MSKELERIAQEIREIKAELSEISQYDFEGYFNSVGEYFEAEDLLIKKRLILGDLNYNDSGSTTASFHYGVLPKNVNKFEKIIKKFRGTIVETRAYDKNGNEVYHDL